MHAKQGGLESYYDSTHHQHEFDHFSIYARLDFIECHAGIEERSAVESSEDAIPKRLLALEQIISGIDPVRSKLDPPLERLNHLETGVIGFRAAALVNVTRLFP